MIPSMTQQQKLTTSSSSLSLLVFVALLFLLFLLLEKDCSRSSSSHHHRDKKAATKVLSSEKKKKKKKKKRTSSSRLCVMLFFPVRKNFCWCFCPTVFSNENFWAIDRRIFSLFFLIKRKLKNTSSRGTHHIITRAHKKKNDDDENDDDDFEENDFDSSLPLRRELFVWDFNCFCRAGIPRQRAFLCVVFFLDHFSQNHHHRRAFWRLCLFFFSHRRGLQNSAPLPARRRLRRVLSVCRGRSRFEGCFSRKFFFCFFFSTKTEDWRKKWVLLDDVGKNTNQPLHRNSLFAGCEKY